MQRALLCYTNGFIPLRSSHLSPVLPEPLWAVPRAAWSLSELSAACSATRSSVCLRAGKSSVLTRIKAVFWVLRTSRKLAQQTIFPLSFAKRWNIYSLSESRRGVLRRTRVEEGGESDICRQGIRKRKPVLEGRYIDSPCSHVFTIDTEFGFFVYLLLLLEVLCIFN